MTPEASVSTSTPSNHRNICGLPTHSDLRNIGSSFYSTVPPRSSHRRCDESCQTRQPAHVDQQSTGHTYAPAVQIIFGVCVWRKEAKQLDIELQDSGLLNFNARQHLHPTPLMTLSMTLDVYLCLLPRLQSLADIYHKSAPL